MVVTTILQEEFINTMETIVTKKQSFKVKKEEGWYSEEEMRNDLGWNQYHALLCIYLIVLQTLYLENGVESNQNAYTNGCCNTCFFFTICHCVKQISNS